MPYASVDDLPKYVRKLDAKQQRRWRDIWNSAYASCTKKGGSAKSCETSAFKQANGVVLKAGEDGDQDRHRGLDDFWPLILAALASLRFEQFATGDQSATVLDQLAEAIYAMNVRAFEKALRQAVTAAGGDVSSVALTNPDVLAELRTAAYSSAQSIVDTYLADLERMVLAAPSEATASELAALLRQWSTLRSTWKVPQIARTETSTTAGKALIQFIERSNAVGTASFEPADVGCPECLAIAGRNPYDLSDHATGVIPHPNCQHSWRTNIVASGPLWMGE